ncbi:MAG: histidine phosphatase family protein, partial [Oceanicaulis sp.]
VAQGGGRIERGPFLLAGGEEGVSRGLGARAARDLAKGTAPEAVANRAKEAVRAARSGRRATLCGRLPGRLVKIAEEDPVLVVAAKVTHVRKAAGCDGKRGQRHRKASGGRSLALAQEDEAEAETLVRATAFAEAAQARTLYASTLPRAIETAQACCGGREIALDSTFVEAPLPPPRMPGRFTARTWGIYARCSWWAGHARGRETRGQAEGRAATASEMLIEAARHGPVILFAHGWFNRMMRPQLKKRGWQCVRDGGDWYWSWRRYEFKNVSQRSRGG